MKPKQTKTLGTTITILAPESIEEWVSKLGEKACCEALFTHQCFTQFHPAIRKAVGWKPNQPIPPSPESVTLAAGSCQQALFQKD